MQGQMMHRPLRIADILTFAEDSHKTSEVISRTVEGDLNRITYPDMAARARQMAKALIALDISLGDRVATLAWNGYRHLELYYAISGIGAVCHTINPRLSPEQMLYIIGHAEDRLLFLDLTFVPLVEKLAPQLPKTLRFVVMTARAHMPDSPLDLLCYEDLLTAQDPHYAWPEFPEDTASGLCYTSGTTGHPKGALYSHRSTVLHTMLCAISLRDCLQPGRKILPVVPLFHVNAWGLPYAAPLTGASLVMPGPRLDGASLWDLMNDEQVFSAWGVPTVWLGLLAEIKQRGAKPVGFGEVIIGGSAAPRSMIDAFERMDVSVCHAWGMTEMSPVGTVGHLPPSMDDHPLEQRVDVKAKQGRRCFGVDLKIVDEAGAALPHDGQASGELYVRGNSIVSGYFANPEATAQALDPDGWFGTGDVASIDADGFLTITDRAKDLIKSGGEWISSLDVENMAMSHPGIANCAVIAVPHPKWDERPLMVAVAAEDIPPKKSDILSHLAQYLAKWQLPDDIVFVDTLPLTATGKVSKLTLRQEYADHALPA
ncbi:long-chain-fatty-acid--CoA ligase [Actibacterium sp. 188UL27-1]|uniref:long-chain-fatty-acid--CoA ligase n=1 Tax=Actibacterium sp. 188UL27-1 TaxID=2786961 RepID=UPI00195EB8D2|nr:long-chain-fatty-acid--CoA ligase [Actibacterium sp. 188UL27-1]MBM7069539.1 long-chain-fatty-acid--CoA ligase [Actibacterium sp. 188UL27-1]